MERGSCVNPEVDLRQNYLDMVHAVVYQLRKPRMTVTCLFGEVDDVKALSSFELTTSWSWRAGRLWILAVAVVASR